MKRIAIIGAGAAGCFLAQRLLELRPDFRVEIFEAQDRPLKKVAITGGGRCNLTNSFDGVEDLYDVYPRGHQLLKRLMYAWNQWDTMSWFEERGYKISGINAYVVSDVPPGSGMSADPRSSLHLR
jgi:predicted flavoprotein YhiN